MALIITNIGDIAEGTRFRHFEVTFKADGLDQDLCRRLSGEILAQGGTRWGIWPPEWCHRLKGLDISGLVLVEVSERTSWAFVRFPNESWVTALRESAYSIQGRE